MTIYVKLQQWHGWAPQLHNREQWRQWLHQGTVAKDSQAKPACKGTPAMLRRRGTMNVKTCAETALHLCHELEIDPAQTHLLFGTANGEASSLRALLDDLCIDEALSPTAFTNSVHHIPTGYLSIAAQHQGIARTISAFENTFLCTYLDMLGLFQSQGHLPALLVISDEMLPQPFDQMLESPPFPFGMAFIFHKLERAEPGAISFQRESETAGQDWTHKDSVFQFLKWYDSDAQSLSLNTSFGVVTWKKH